MLGRVPRNEFFWARWVFLRSLGLWFLSAFYSLAFQIKGLIGARGVSPVCGLFDVLRVELPWQTRGWEVPSLLWLDCGDSALTVLWVVGGLASLALILNRRPVLAIGIALVCFLSFVAAAQQFSAYQSDGMLLSAGFCSLFFAPRGRRPGLGLDDPPSRLARLSLVWLWFCIYFGSGVVKLLSGDAQWRTLTAMDHYYENGPLPSFLGWYVQQLLPEGFHQATAAATLGLELGLCWFAFFPSRFRRAVFAIVTPFQLGIILTSNYAFLNWLVLSLGLLLVDDAAVTRCGLKVPAPGLRPAELARAPWLRGLAAACLAVYFYVSGVELLGRFLPLGEASDAAPVTTLAPFRIANGYGLFAVMTRDRYEIEFQGSNDGATWVPYRFRYKPQSLAEGGGLYAPYQPRFEWNLWFASLGRPAQNTWVGAAAQELREGSPDVLALFQEDPFHGSPPAQVRAVRWQYWYTTPAEKRATGNYWRRELRDVYVPPLGR